MEKIKKTDVALLELLTGIFLSGILFSLAGLFLLFFKELSLGKYLVSMWLGILVAGGFSVHMWRSLNKAFGCEESQASRMLATGYVIRYLLAAVFLLELLATLVADRNSEETERRLNVLNPYFDEHRLK